MNNPAKRQFMVRILQNNDEYADVVVDADNESDAKLTALEIVKNDPQTWFDAPPPPRYSVDPSVDVEELDGSEYESANAFRM